MPPSRGRSFATLRVSSVNSRAYATATRRLDQDPRFAALRHRNGGQALRMLFSEGVLNGVQIPGRSAAERVRFVLFYMSGQDGPEAKHRVQPCWEKTFSQEGLHRMLRDGTSLTQIGHFCTAISVGFWARGPVDRMVRYSAAIGHELVGNELVLNVASMAFPGLADVRWQPVGRVVNAVTQGAAGLPSVLAFRPVIEAAKRRDHVFVARACRLLAMHVPERQAKTGLQAWIHQQLQWGNSQGDLRATLFGFAIAEMVQDQVIRTRDELLRYLDGCVLDRGAVSGP